MMADSHTLNEMADILIKHVANLDSKTVHISGAETVTGDKTFTGGVTVGGYEPECIVDKGDGYIRYSSGLQLCWGWSGTFTARNDTRKTFTFAKSFKMPPHVLSSPSAGGNNWASYSERTSSSTTTGTISTWVSSGYDNEAIVGYQWLAIGFWK